MGTTSWDQAQGLPPILTWCIALLSDDNRWQSVAGSGAVYDECRREGQQQLKEPHRTAAKADAWQAVVIQDFQRWLESADTSIYNCISLAQRRQIRSWLAVPMQVDGKVRALMIAHSPHAHYFSAFRVRLMEHAAKRLLPLLAAAQREIRTRSAFTAAVMYEVKNDSHAALLLLKQIVAEHAPGPPSEALTDIYHYVEGLNALGQDALDVFQLGRGERFQDPTGPERDQTVILGDLLGGMTLGWVTLYEDTRLDIDLPEPLGRRRIRIIRASSFRRVARILMHNAFRHGREWVRIAVHLQESQNADTRLLIEVSNLAYEEIASSLAERLNLAIARLGSSPLARGRLGLAVARQLTTESGGTLGEFESASTNDEDLVTVKISLSWPIQSITENQDETT